MRFTRKWAALALVAIALAGCGGDSDETTSSGSETRPDDFSFVFQHVDGSTPPPFHAEWRVEVDADGAGTATYVPDYAGDGIPTYESEFTVDGEQLDAIYADMSDAGLLADIGTTDDQPIGGPIETVTITADGETYDVPPFDEEGSSPAAMVSEAVVALVPAADWKSFETKRDSYAQRKYGEKP